MERLDLRLYQQLDDTKVLRRDSRTLDDLLGSITFKRRLVQWPDGTLSYLLDEYLKITSRRRYSPALTRHHYSWSDIQALLSSDRSVNSLIASTISHFIVGMMAKQVGHLMKIFG